MSLGFAHSLTAARRPLALNGIGSRKLAEPTPPPALLSLDPVISEIYVQAR